MLLCILSIKGSAQSLAEISLQKELAAATSDTARARICGDLAWELKFIYNDTAEHYAKEEIQYAHGDPLLLANAYRTLGLLRVIVNKTAEGLDYYSQSMDYARKAKSLYYEASCYSLMAGMYQDMGDYDRSLHYYTEGLRAAEKSQNPKMIGTLCNNIASIYDATGRSAGGSLQYYKRALAKALEIKSYAFAELIAANMANGYIRTGQQDSAEIMVKATLDFIKASADRGYEYASAHASIGDVYVQMKKPAEAERFFTESIAVMDSLRRPINVLYPLSSLSRLYLQENKIALAEKLAQRLVKDGTQYHAKLFIREGYKVLSDVAHLRHQDAEALKLYEQFNVWDDSVFNDTKEQSIANTQSRADLAQRELEVQYQTRKRQQENQILKLQNNNLRAYVIGGVVGLLLLSFLVFRVHRSGKQQEEANRALAQKNSIIEQQSKEKDLLMMEIHHRVKNNLQIVSSLLNLQANSISDQTAKEALRESQNRVKSIALIHQKLYKQGDLSAILISDYATQLAQDLRALFNADKIEIVCKAEPASLKLDIETSISLGLILNELLTNAIKYAQINRPGGRVEMLFSDDKAGNCRLVFSDNGIGMASAPDLKNTRTLGLRIVNELTRQLKGTMTYDGKRGSIFTLIFPRETL
jgi:two-component sensor histidine kinase